MAWAKAIKGARKFGGGNKFLSGIKPQNKKQLFLNI